MVSVMIVEDDALFRDMLSISLGFLPNVRVLGTVSDGESAIETANLLTPDVILMDIDLGSEPDGITTGCAIKSCHPEMGVVILSSHREREYINRVTTGDANGWSYLLKQSVGNIAVLGQAVEGAASGLVVLDPEVINIIHPPKNSITAGLTPRQIEVLDAMAQGYNNVGIAEKMVIRTKSVENYVNGIYQQLEIDHNGPMNPRVQAVLTYLRDSL